MVLRGDKYQARTGRDWLGSRRPPERAQDAEHCDVGGENAEADGSKYGEAEDYRHQKRDHGSKSLKYAFKAGHFRVAKSLRQRLQSTCVDAPR